VPVVRRVLHHLGGWTRGERPRQACSTIASDCRAPMPHLELLASYGAPEKSRPGAEKAGSSADEAHDSLIMNPVIAVRDETKKRIPAFTGNVAERLKYVRV